MRVAFFSATMAMAVRAISENELEGQVESPDFLVQTASMVEYFMPFLNPDSNNLAQVVDEDQSLAELEGEVVLNTAV